MSQVQLFETNAGHLFIVQGGKSRMAYDVTETEDRGRFADDARALASANDWTCPALSPQEVDDLRRTLSPVAEYLNGEVVVRNPHCGIAAKKYLGIDE